MTRFFSMFLLSPLLLFFASRTTWASEPPNDINPVTSNSNLLPAIASEEASPVRLSVFVPPDAKLMVNGKLTTSTGPIRSFISPPIVPGYHYIYEVTATWEENGKTIIHSKEVIVTAGSHASVIMDPGAGKGPISTPVPRP